MSTTITENKQVVQFTKNLISNIPSDWSRLTTHRLDIYNENLAKTEFMEGLIELFKNDSASQNTLAGLPTAYDYIRLGHPLSCVLEWFLAEKYNMHYNYVISFSSKSTPVMAILRKNALEGKATQIVHIGDAPNFLSEGMLESIYDYNYSIKRIDKIDELEAFEGSVVMYSNNNDLSSLSINSNVDFYVNAHSKYGSVLYVNGAENESYIKEIQHVRRRETIAMTPSNCLAVLNQLVGNEVAADTQNDRSSNKKNVVASIKKITAVDTDALIGSSGLSMQYAIVMGLIDHANEHYPNKPIKIAIPPNCYGGTNDQARRVAASIKNVEIVDLPVDGEHNMVQSIDMVLDDLSNIDAVPYIIAEIPTNPRVEVPDMQELKAALTKDRVTKNGAKAVAPVFILDQTFCPNVHFLGDDEILAPIQTIAYVSGSKFPSGGLCTAGYCVANSKANHLMSKIEKHLVLCDNEATDLQMEILAKQLPSMNARIASAYEYTRDFVSFIRETLPSVKINFVSEELAEQSFTPSVFSLDLPSKGSTPEEKEANKRELNDRLITMMINEIPEESKYCVSYGQLKGCYWTIPATSTQGTTKEGDKDYIVRVAMSGNMDLEKHKSVFKSFVDTIK